MPAVPDTVRRWAAALFATLVMGAQPALAQAQEDPAQQAVRQRLEALQDATVGVEVRVVEGAASGRTLGRQRKGTGVLVDAQGGLVLTIGYLVLEAESVQLVTRDQRKLPATVVAYDAVSGLGLLRPLVPLPNARPVKLGMASALAKGSPLLVATGSSPRQVGAVRLVDKRPFTGYWEYHLDTGLFTSPPLLNHSGAGLFNAEGELVGLGHLLMRDVMPADSAQALPGNLFVPVEVLPPILDALLRTGEHPQARRPWMGVNAAEMDAQVRITRVNEGSPAESAGLRPGHWVTAVDGEPVRTLEAFYKKVWAHPAADGPIRITIREAGQTRTLEVPVRDRSQGMARPRGI